MKGKHGIVLLVCCLFLFNKPSQAKRKNAPSQIPPNILRDKRGQPVRFSTEQMIQKMIHCIPVAFPPLGKNLRIQGEVTVELLVNPEGKVWWVRATRGHPLLKDSVIEAARKWTFASVVSKGKQVYFFGRLTFQLSRPGGQNKDVHPCVEFA